MPGGPLLDPALEPTHDELLLGSMLRRQPGIAPLPAERRTPRAAIEDALRPALQRGRCFVLFSGGFDSSMLLALATHVARREGLEPPIPLSHRYPGDAASDENDWQELVVTHLGLNDWEIAQIDDQHDLLGPMGLHALRHHGAQLPTYWWITRIPVSAGGTPYDAPPPAQTNATLVAGHGGDEAFPANPWPSVSRLLRGDLRALRHPRALRRELHGERWRIDYVVSVLSDDFPWIRPGHRDDVLRRRATEIVALRRPYDRYLEDLWRSRITQVQLSRIGAAARSSGADLLSPMQRPDVLGAFAARYGRTPPPSRAEAYREIAGDLLPAALYARQTKASARSGFVGEHTRDWLLRWDGDGPDADAVDGTIVRQLLLDLGQGTDGGDARVTALAARARLAELD